MTIPLLRALPAALPVLPLFWAGLLAGIECAVYLGVRAPMAALDPAPQTVLRQGLIRRLRVLVPVVYLATVLSTVAAVARSFGRPDIGSPGATIARAAAGLALLAWTAATFGGTVPINQAVLAWRPDALPADWRATVARWERLDAVRCAAAVAAFAALVAAAALGATGR